MESQGMFRSASSWQTHHLIPQAVWKENKAFFNSIGRKGKEVGDELKKIRKDFRKGKIIAAQAGKRVQNLQKSLKKRLSKSISVGWCASANSPK